MLLQQKRVITMLTKSKILTTKGTLNEEGFSFEELKTYNKEAVPFIYKSRLKEWDYYSFVNDEMGFLLTISNNSYMSYVSCSFVDLINKSYLTKTFLTFFSPNKFKLPLSPKKGNILLNTAHYYIVVKKTTNNIKILAKLNSFLKKQDLIINLDVTNTNKNNSIFILHPFKNKHHFYYNFKENLLLGKGYIKLGNVTKSFEGNGVYDFGRGIWPYKTEWFWISSSLKNEKESKGFNLGCGFGSLQDSENVVYLNDEHYKLSDLILDIPKNEKGKINYLDEWKLKDEKGNISLSFTPIVNRKDSLNFLILSTHQNQVFGKFNGEIKVENKVIKFKDQVGFIEHFKIRW